MARHNTRPQHQARAGRIAGFFADSAPRGHTSAAAPSARAASMHHNSWSLPVTSAAQPPNQMPAKLPIWCTSITTPNKVPMRCTPC